MTEQLCTICTEKYNKTRHKIIKCQYCDFECCRTCCQTYILDQPTVRCMNNDCAKEWTRQYIRSVLPLTFINNELKEHKEQVLFDQERALMPATQPLVERQMRLETLANEEREMNKEIQNMYMKMNAIRNQIYRLRHRFNRDEDTETERATFVRACPNENCKGFLSSQWKCGICQLWTCPSCHVVKGNARDIEHTCNPDDVATADLLKTDTKPCPNCGFGIFKIDGCDQMYCVQCHTAFSWRTGRIETGNIHNPHYFEWMRRQGNNPARNPDDIICGRELDHRLICSIDSQIEVKFYKNKHKYDTSQEQEIKQKTASIIELARNILHIRGVEMYRFEFNYERYNEDLRILYMRNLISEHEFKHRLQIQNKKQHKNIELRNIFRLVVDSMTDIIFRFYEETKKTDWEFDFSTIDEAETLRQYANECLLDISRTYGSVKMALNPKFAIIKVEKTTSASSLAPESAKIETV